ncbi:nonribosomal peptide synthase [Penicillium diatomitis]|uniref:Nonribosomal peptide synthase n=1 Tax=Penicillium diatomitis TaxID=2819901 RepID=A0A9W9XL37_9EURO|nr:nonribosomal peptide synthase [Penicillium diatomitis]KAJ5495002.1 nonribosomal peptide synthase [Penicillium diatomitis]
MTPSAARTIDPAGVSCVERALLVGEPIHGRDISVWKSTGMTALSYYGQLENSKASMIRPLRSPISIAALAENHDESTTCCDLASADPIPSYGPFSTRQMREH